MVIAAVTLVPVHSAIKQTRVSMAGCAEPTKKTQHQFKTVPVWKIILVTGANR